MVIIPIVVTWILLNLLLPKAGIEALDESPFHLLQGMIGLAALLATSKPN